jgi:hypothetical protein
MTNEVYLGLIFFYFQIRFNVIKYIINNKKTAKRSFNNIINYNINNFYFLNIEFYIWEF